MGAATNSAARTAEHRVLLAGGGSGGHVFPALAVGEELGRRGWGVDFVGAAGGMEEGLVEEAGLPFHSLPARPVVGRGLGDRMAAMWTLAKSAWRARRLIRDLGADVVVGTGGYVSAPAVMGAALTRVPSLLVEPNARAGLANRLLSRWAADAALAFETTARSLRCPSTVTGVPVRTAFADLPECEIGAGTVADPVRVLVLGGSQGSEQLNREVPAALGRLLEEGADLPEVLVVHQAGRGKVDTAVEAYGAAGVALQGPDVAPSGRSGTGVTARVVDFIDDTAAEIGDAHLVISRAGAITCAEICAAGRASLLVPLVAAAGHQMDNARALAQAGAAVVAGIEDRVGDELAESLAEDLGGLLADRERLAAMGRGARALGRPTAAAAIADRVERLAGVAPTPPSDTHDPSSNPSTDPTTTEGAAP